VFSIPCTKNITANVISFYIHVEQEYEVIAADTNKPLLWGSLKGTACNQIIQYIISLIIQYKIH
jgi:outer membrane lipopolysaccharide assembly protein LptE/RlpB